MSRLLATDFHLDDNPANEYRWRVFDAIGNALDKYSFDEIIILGDIVDRRDRHSGVLVNRLVRVLRQLTEFVPVFILRGNHDSPLKGPAFWEFLTQDSHHQFISYVTSPTSWRNHILLPFSPDPRNEWSDIDWSKYKAAFLHATPAGALAENGMALQGSNLPILPRSLKIYSGDVHTPQTVRNWTLVGAPHPIHFGDHYDCRMLVIDDNYDITHEIKLDPPRKHMIDINSLDDLEKITTRPGDQARVRVNISISDLEAWSAAQNAIAVWAQERGVAVASSELTVDTPISQGPADLERDPAAILRDFAAAEEISDTLLEVGLSLLREVR